MSLRMNGFKCRSTGEVIYMVMRLTECGELPSVCCYSDYSKQCSYDLIVTGAWFMN